MNTHEARTRMRDLALDAALIAGRLAGDAPTREERTRLRELVAEARSLLSDAGFPGEAVWRSLQRASMGAETYFDEADPAFWAALTEDLRSAAETLDHLVAPVRRESDFHIVG